MTFDVTDAPNAPHRTPDHPSRVPTSFLVSYALANLGLWLGLLPPVIVSLQLRIQDLDPDGKETSLGLVLGAGALLGLIANPICGRLSDRTTARWGMRRPWLLGGAVLGVAGLAVMAVAPNIAILGVGWCVTCVAYNGLMAALFALLPDQVPPARRGTVSALIGVGQALAAVIGTAVTGALSGNNVAMMLAPGLLALVLCVPLLFLLRDRVLDPAGRPRFGAGELLRSFWVNPRRHPDFGWAFLSRFMIFMAIASVLNYQIFFLSDRLDMSTDEAQRTVLSGVAAQTVAVVLSSNLVGWLSDRLGRRRVFVCVSALIAAAGLLVLAGTSGLPQYLGAMVLVGLGQGTYFAVDLALVADVLPDRTRDAGKDLGVMNIATTLPQSLAPAVAPIFIGLGAGANYTALFVAGCGYAVVSGVTVLAVRGAR